jgi:hypothetical protein
MPTAFTGVVDTGSVVRLSWSGPVGVFHTVWQTPDLGDTNAWVALSGDISSIAETNEWTDSSSSNAVDRSYRIMEVPR